MEETKEDNLKHPSSVFGNMVSGLSFSKNDLKNWSKREYILLGVLAGTFFIMIVLAGVLGAKKSYSPPDTCTSYQCLESAAYVRYTMNTTFDPCNDFYQYACGAYASTRPLTPGRTSRTTMGDLYYKNQERLKNLMEAPYNRDAEWSSERKLKDLFRSCINDYKTEQLLGQPFIQKILPKMQGWYVLDTWEQNTFDLNAALKIVQTDLWVAAFWTNSVGMDIDMKTNIVQLHPAGASKFLRWSQYITPGNQRYLNDYKKFMRRLANLIIRDYKPIITDKDIRIEQFVNDAFTMETKLAQLYNDSKVTNDRYSEESKIVLDDLNAQTGTVIDWAAQMKYEFKSITGASKVILYKKEFIYGLSNLITNLPSADKTRVLHNYMVWRLLERYAPELSWEYVHANREYYVDVFGVEQFSGKWNYCFGYVNRMMPEAMGSLFVRDHFPTENKQKAVEITTYLRSAVIDELNANTWMNSDTKKIAIQKITKLIYKIGFPAFMLDGDQLDKIYKELAINKTDYFQNILNINQFQKVYYENQLEGGVDRTRWIFKTFDTNMALLYYWNEIIVPAGFLQSPLYDYHMPHYMNFGSMGSLIGKYLTFSIDQYGSKWTAEGTRTASWWSNGTYTAYQKVKKCVVNYYSNRTQGPFQTLDGDSKMIPINAELNVDRSIAITTGVKLALRAYEKWEHDHGVEKAAPSLGLSNEQMFYIAHAQSRCFNRNNNQRYYNALNGLVEYDTQTNLALSQIPEFQQAFKCKAGSKMVAASKCAYY
ncbi:endothelin-converting enzyme homolog [Patella vulgata]|uniref:endothelin-converting enzyme homolog n=1 Tax=Patella vulgata TaxID=6465 RepID=UPI00217F5D37|nr:endothelin-converting enzyme homolog [Patella vulgata]